MKKLLVGFLALFVFSALFAASATPEVSWSGTAYFTLGVDEKGVDVDGGLSKFTLKVTPNSDTQAGVSFGFDFIAGTVSFKSLTFENDYFGLTYAPGAVGFNKFFGGLTDTNGDYVPDTPVVPANDYIDVSVKALEGLEVVFMDVKDGEVDYNTGAGGTFIVDLKPGLGHWLDDFVGVKYSLAGVNLAAAVYDGTLDDSASVEFGLAADTSLGLDFGTIALEGLVAMVDNMATPVYGVSEGYKGTFDFVTVKQNFKWFENVNLLTYKGDDALTGKSFDVTLSAVNAVTDELSVNGSLAFKIADLTTPSNFTVPVSLGVDYESAFSAGLSLSWDDVVGAATAIVAEVYAGYEADMFSLNLTADWADLVGAPNSIKVDLTAGFAVDMVSGNAELKWADLVNDATNVVATLDVKVVPLDELTLTGAVKYAGGEFGYNAGLSYAVAADTTFSAFYGTLYDADGDGKVDINKTDAQWYLKLSWSTSF